MPVPRFPVELPIPYTPLDCACPLCRAHLCIRSADATPQQRVNIALHLLGRILAELPPAEVLPLLLDEDFYCTVMNSYASEDLRNLIAAKPPCKDPHKTSAARQKHMRSLLNGPFLEEVLSR